MQYFINFNWSIVNLLLLKKNKLTSLIDQNFEFKNFV